MDDQPRLVYVAEPGLARAVFPTDRTVGRAGEVRREVMEPLVGPASLLCLEGDRWPLEEPFALRPRAAAITLDVILQIVFGVRDAAKLERPRALLPALIEAGTAAATLGFLGGLGERVFESRLAGGAMVIARRRSAEAPPARRRSAAPRARTAGGRTRVPTAPPPARAPGA